MDFRTRVEWPHQTALKIRYSEEIMLMGSCFTDHIGNLLMEHKFRCDLNPFGVLYNPLSIVETLHELLQHKVYTCSDIFEGGGLWHSWMHHSTFSAATSDDCLLLINERLQHSAQQLRRARWLIITWGTAYAYFHRELSGALPYGGLVGNCHKQPDCCFERKRLSVDEIVGEWNLLIEELKAVNPDLNILFTVSPIRHIKDGLHGNQLSKSTLLLAVDTLCQRHDHCDYFPSYEILMDELRDYRFYADDMVHPSKLAVDYIWECFGNLYFDTETQQIMKEWLDIRKALRHKPFHPESEGYKRFLSQIVLKINGLKEKFPYFEVQNELKECQALFQK